MKTYNKELVDQVKSGELAIKNDGSLEELKDLLEHCFPLDPALIGGGSKYYLKHSETYWDSRSNTSLPYKSVKDFFL